MDSIAVIDYGMGNLRSVAKALEHVAQGRAHVVVTDDVNLIDRAERIVFPGQGAARDCMRELTERGLVDTLRHAAASKPFLGICMGMQVLADTSDEDGGVQCLGLGAGTCQGVACSAIRAAGVTAL